MSGTIFRQMCTNLAKQIYPEADGDALIQEAANIYAYLSKNSSQNLVALNFLSTDIIAFSEALSVDNVPLRVRSYQRDLLAAWQAGDESLVIHARGMGISVSLAVYALWTACFGENVRMGFVSATIAQTQEAMALICALHASSSFGLPKFVAHNKSLHFENGNFISFIAPSTYGHGKSLTHLIVENTGDIDLSYSENIFSLFLLTSGHVVMTGTPRLDMGIFYDLVTSRSWFPNATTYLPFTENLEYDEDWEAEMRGQIGHNRFENEYNLKFIRSFERH